MRHLIDLYGCMVSLYQKLIMELRVIRKFNIRLCFGRLVNFRIQLASRSEPEANSHSELGDGCLLLDGHRTVDCICFHG